MTARSRPPLATRVREYRLAAGLSQAALAEAAGLSLRGVSDVERGLKARPHPATLRMLADALGLDASQRAELAALISPASVSSSVPARASSMSLVGRDAERSHLRDLLGDPAVGLVTITGPGGVGKTTLARDLVASGVGQPAVFVDLAVLSPGEPIEPIIASRLDLHEVDERPVATLLAASLQADPYLLVLDNCEHVLPGVRAAVTSLRDVPGVRFVATSRSPLRLRGEWVVPVAPFPVPTGEAPDHEIAESDAVRLLLQRCREQRPDSDRSNDLQAMRAICERVDGLPLAIELAASRMRTIDPATLVSLLDQRLRVLTNGPADAPERHQTLRATIAWSEDLLTAEQQRLFRTVSVFAGGFTLELAAAVAHAGDPFATLDELEALVDAGLVIAEDDGRFRMLQVVRDYGLEKLDLAGEVSAVRYAHATALLVRADAASAAFDRGDSAGALAQLNAEEANLLAALDWHLQQAATGGDPVPACTFLNDLWPWWHYQGRHHESQRWLDRALGDLDRVPAAIRARLLINLANTANNLEQHARALKLYAMVQEIGLESGDDALVLQSAVGVVLVAVTAGDLELAQSMVEKLPVDDAAPSTLMRAAYARGRLFAALDDDEKAVRELDHALSLVEFEDDVTRAYLQLELARVHRVRGRNEAARDLVRSCQATFGPIGERRALAVCNIEDGWLALARSDSGHARLAFRAAVTECADLRFDLGAVWALEGLALVALATGERETAARLHGVTRTWRRVTGVSRSGWETRALAPLDALPDLAVGEGLAAGIALVAETIRTSVPSDR